MAFTTYWNGSDKYICDADLSQSFHMARVLGMPLLIEGEPGTGKTELPIQHNIYVRVKVYWTIMPIILHRHYKKNIKTIFVRYSVI